MQSQWPAMMTILYLMANKITADGRVYTDYITQELFSGIGTTDDSLICL